MSEEIVPVTEWIRSAKRGDETSLEMLLLWFYDQLLIHVRNKVSDHDLPRFDAEDIVQQTHQKIVHSIDGFRGTTPGEFFSWIQRIADNTLADNRKSHNSAKRSGYRKRFSLDQVDRDESSMFLLWDALKSEDETPSSIAISKEEAEQLKQALRHLTDEEGELIQLRYIEQRSSQEVATRIGISGATVLRRCQATLTRIRRLLQSAD